MKRIFAIFLVLTATITVFAQNHVSAYIIDGTDTPTNVRNSPKGDVVTTLNNNDNIVVELIEVKNGWWRIDPVIEFYGDSDYEMTLTGSETGYWIHYSMLCFGIAGDPTNAIKSKPSKKSRTITIPPSTELSFHPIALSGKWVKIVSTDGRINGWLHSDNICFNPLTTCP